MVQIYDLIITQVSVFVNNQANSHEHSSKKRHESAMRLKVAGCDVDVAGRHWIEACTEEHNR